MAAKSASLTPAAIFTPCTAAAKVSVSLVKVIAIAYASPVCVNSTQEVMNIHIQRRRDAGTYPAASRAVVDLMRQNGRSLRQLTIFTGMPRATSYSSAPRLGHIYEAIRGDQYSSAWSL